MTHSQPTVSVLITTYNRGRLLRRAIDSVLMQDFTDFEIVIIDDCSSDDTPDVVAAIQDARIQYIRNETNVGSIHGDRAHVKRFVYELMRGTYFVYLCDDDYWLPRDLLSRQVEIFQSQDNTSFVMGNQLSYMISTPDSLFGHPPDDTITFKLEQIAPYFDIATLTPKTPHLSFIPNLFSKPFLTGAEYLIGFAEEPTTKNRIVGATLYSRAHFIRSGAMIADGSKWQAGYEFLMGPACVGNVGYIDDPCILTEIREQNASFQGTQAEHYLDSIKSIETAFNAPLNSPELAAKRSFFRAIKNETIRNLSYAFQGNTLTILREGSLGLCTPENIRYPVTPQHVISVLWKNRAFPNYKLLKYFFIYAIYRTLGVDAHQRYLPPRTLLQPFQSLSRFQPFQSLRRLARAVARPVWRSLPENVRDRIRPLLLHKRLSGIEMSTKRYDYRDKILPNQEFFRYLYHGAAPYEAELYKLMASYGLDFNASQFKLTTPKNMDFEQMSTPPWQLTLLDALIRFSGAKTVLEIGTFVGHSSMQFARMVGETGHVTTIEVGQEFADIARENFRNNGFEKRITLHQGDAGTILDSLPAASFDLVFVDGSKQDYLDYTLRSEKLLTERGVIVVDDVFFHGDVLNEEPTTDKGLGCKKLLEYFQADGRFNRLLLPVANGILVLYRNRNPD